MGKRTRFWTIEHKDMVIGPLSSYALTLWGLQGLIYPDDILVDDRNSRRQAGYVESMMPIIRNNGHLSRAKLWAIAGGKGGVGKSVLTVLMAVSLARAGKRVVIVDVDFNGPNQRQLFSLRRSSPDIWTLLAENQPIRTAALATSVPNLRLITAPEQMHHADRVNILHHIRFISALRHLDADYVLLDFGPRTDLHELGYFHTADLNLIVSTAEPTAMENLSRFIKTVLKHKWLLVLNSLNAAGSDRFDEVEGSTPLIQQMMDHFIKMQIPAEEMMRRVMGSFSLRVLFNQVRDAHFQPQMKLLNAYLQHEIGLAVEIAGVVPYDAAIHTAIRVNRLFSLAADLPIMQRIDHLVHDLCRIKNQQLLAYQRAEAAVVRDDSALMCGVWCSAWGDCNFQDPGHICLVKNLNVPEEVRSTSDLQKE